MVSSGFILVAWYLELLYIAKNSGVIYDATIRGDILVAGNGVILVAANGVILVANYFHFHNTRISIYKSGLEKLAAPQGFASLSFLCFALLSFFCFASLSFFA